MAEVTVTRPHMVIRRYSSFEEAEQADIDYWNSRTIDEKMEATLELIEDAHTVKKIALNRKGPA